MTRPKEAVISVFTCRATACRPALVGFFLVATTLLALAQPAHAQWSIGVCTISFPPGYSSTGYPFKTKGGAADGYLSSAISEVFSHASGTVPAGEQSVQATIGFKANCVQLFNYSGAGTPPILSPSIRGFVKLIGNGGQGRSAYLDSEGGTLSMYYTLGTLGLPSPGTKPTGPRGPSVQGRAFTLQATSNGNAYGVGSTFDTSSTANIVYTL